MTSSQSTSRGYGSRIALRLCGTTAVGLVCEEPRHSQVGRHCRCSEAPALTSERSEAIHGTSATKLDCFAALAMTGVAAAGKHTQLSFPDVQLHIVDAPLGAGPESITTDGGYGVRARCCASLGMTG